MALNLGGPGGQQTQWMAGAPTPAGDGRIPTIPPAALYRSASDITRSLGRGPTPDFDVAGGHMARVLRNLARLPQATRAAVTADLKPPGPLARRAG